MHHPTDRITHTTAFVTPVVILGMSVFGFLFFFLSFFFFLFVCCWGFFFCFLLICSFLGEAGYYYNYYYYYIIIIIIIIIILLLLLLLLLLLFKNIYDISTNVCLIKWSYLVLQKKHFRFSEIKVLNTY